MTASWHFVFVVIIIAVIIFALRVHIWIFLIIDFSLIGVIACQEFGLVSN